MKKIFVVIFCVVLPIFIMLFSYKSVLFFADLDINQENTIDYLQNNGELLLNYTSSEGSHLEDVKKVMRFSDYLFYFCLLVLTLILTFYRKKKEETKKLLVDGGITTAVLLGMILLFLLTAFNSAFTLFHNLFFSQGNWMFAFDSLLIQTFPLDFFIGMSYKIFLLSLGLGIGIIVIGKKYK